MPISTATIRRGPAPGLCRRTVIGTLFATVLQSHAATKPLKIGMLVPLSGPAGLFGSSCRNCSEIGAAEINARGGIVGRPVELRYADAGVAPAEVVRAATALRQEGVSAFVGMHDSAVRVALTQQFKGQVAYVYTPTYEGGECSRGTYVLGETPSQQLRPVIPWMALQMGVRRWYLIGNDYNWPRGTNTAAKTYIAGSGGTVVGEEYAPFGVDDFEEALNRIRDSRADAVLITLVGGASVRFNQAFAARKMANKVIRLGTLLEENTLRAIGAASSMNLYASSGYFATIRTPAAKLFAAEYATRFGADGPQLNVLAQSCYEGLRLLEVMGNKAQGFNVERLEQIAQWQITEGPRGMTVLHGRHAIRDIYVGKAEGAVFNIVKTFEAVRALEDCQM